MDGIDIGLFDYDRYNTLYFFLMNADEQIYMRYGGRDSFSPNTYLNLDSLELALEQGLELHRRYQQGELKERPRPEPLFPRDIPALYERTIGSGRCVECHLIGDLQNVQREREGKLDRLAHMFRSPDIKRLGIHLDIPKGLVVKETKGAAQAGGMEAGDRITHLNGTSVRTFADLQYYYDKVPRDAERIHITVERGGESIELPITLPERWWWTDLTYRQWSVEPRVYFKSRPLTESEKRERGLAPDGFASEVTRVESVANLLKVHELQEGDIIFAVDGVERDEIAHTAELFMKLHTTAGATATLDVMRDGERLQLDVKTARMSFRK